MEKNNKPVMVIGVILVLCLIAAGIFAMTTDSAERKLAQQLELGQKYLDELDYEQAVVAYKAAIEIDPKCEEAYLALAEIYVTMEDYENAIDILSQGIEQTGSEKLVEYLAEVEAIYSNIGNVDEEQVTNTSDEFSENEKVLERVIGYNADGNIYFYEVYEYDKNGDRVKTIIHNADGSVRLYKGFEYDENGNDVKYTQYNADGSIDVYLLFKYEYDEDGDIVKDTGYYADGSIAYFYEYDENDNIIKYTTYHADGSISIDQFWVYEYDENSNIVKYTQYNADGSIAYFGIYEYDENDNIERQIAYNADGSMFEHSVKEYDENDNITKVTYYNADGSISYYHVYEYE